jgi:hypothetical protein
MPRPIYAEYSNKPIIDLVGKNRRKERRRRIFDSIHLARGQSVPFVPKHVWVYGPAVRRGRHDSMPNKSPVLRGLRVQVSHRQNEPIFEHEQQPILLENVEDF